MAIKKTIRKRVAEAIDPPEVVAVVAPTTLVEITENFQREDMNLLRDKMNEIIRFIKK